MRDEFVRLLIHDSQTWPSNQHLGGDAVNQQHLTSSCPMKGSAEAVVKAGAVNPVRYGAVTAVKIQYCGYQYIFQEKSEDKRTGEDPVFGPS